MLAAVPILLIIGIFLTGLSPIFEVTSPTADYAALGIVMLSIFSGSIVGLLLARRHEKH